MKYVTMVCSFVLLLAAASSAQIDIMELNSFGVIANFSEDEGDRSWSSIGCDGSMGEQFFEIITDPDDGANMVGVFTSTSCTDEGFALDQEFVPFDFSLHTHMTLDVYAPAVGGKVVFKIFSSVDPANEKMVEAAATKASEWDTLNFDFSGTEAGIYDRISIHPDFGETTEGVEWLFDNIRQSRGGLLSIPNDGMLVDFDTVNPFLHYWDCNSLTGEFMIVENPLKEGINTSDMCGLYITSDCQWEGFAIAEKFAPLDFTVTNQARVKVLAPAPDLQLMFKVELWENSGIMVETTATTTVGDEWEELIFDLSPVQSFYYTKIAIFPDFTSTYVDDEWYMDDIMIVDPNNVAVDDEARVIKVFALSAINYPNPFNPTTTIAYEVPIPSNVKITVFDMTGRELGTLVDREHTPGTHTVQFEAEDLASGVYFYKVETAYDVLVNKMVLLR